MLEQQQKISPRAQRLKQSLKQHLVRSDGNIGVTTTACIERARYMTESFKQTDGEPYVIRRAKAFANYLEKKTIYIMEDELLVGHLGNTPTSLPFYMEYMPKEVLRGALGSKYALTADEWKEFDEITDYWKGKTLEEVNVRNLPPDIREAVYPPEEGDKWCYSTMFRFPETAPSSNLEMLFSLGMNGIKKKIEASLAKVNAEFTGPNYPLDKVPETLKKRDHLNAMLIAADAVIKFVERYSKLASEMAEKEKDPTRKTELEQMAKNLNIAEPVKTFWQAVQISWLDHMISHVFEAMCGGICQRLDRLYLPYYKHDLEAGTLTQEQAREILEDLWIKYERAMGILTSASSRPSAQGSNVLFQNVTLGGVDEFGRDCTNELTYLMLDLTKNLMTVQPTLSIRYNPGTPDELLIKAWDVLKKGIGMPAFFNDKPIVEHLLDRGMSLKDARNNVVAGCVAVAIAGKNILHQLPVPCALNAAKSMELALNDGVDIMDGHQYGEKTGDPRNFKTYEDVVEAFRKQFVDHFTKGWRASQICRSCDAEILQIPYSSALNENCIQMGLDARTCHDYEAPFFGCISGVIDAVDSLAAIKKLVYDEKKVTMDEMVKAIKANFKGYENILQLCRDAPKFGSDDPYVDSIARDTYELLNKEARNFKDRYGGWFDLQYHSVSTFMPFGMMTAALPCGRKAREPLSDGGISPETGFGKEPTRVLKSVSWVDASKTQRMLLNQRLNPATTPRQFIDLIRAWGDLGISQIQFNVFKTETLRDAQAHPEKYPDLLVRVAGYSAVFVSLARPTQEAIIARSEQTLPTKSTSSVC